MARSEAGDLDAALRAVAVTAGRGRVESASQVVDRSLELVEAGVTAILLREPGRDSRELLALAERLHEEVTVPAGAALIISDRIDIALAVGAEGAHLGFRSLDAGAARRLVRDRLWLGFSLHDPVAANAATIQSVHYVTFGPVFETPSKRGWVDPVGVERLGEVARSLERPVVALGGLDRHNVGSIAGCGLTGVAMIRGLWDAPEPAAVVAAIREAAC